MNDEIEYIKRLAGNILAITKKQKLTANFSIKVEQIRRLCKYIKKK